LFLNRNTEERQREQRPAPAPADGNRSKLLLSEHLPPQSTSCVTGTRSWQNTATSGLICHPSTEETSYRQNTATSGLICRSSTDSPITQAELETSNWQSTATSGLICRPSTVSPLSASPEGLPLYAPRQITLITLARGKQARRLACALDHVKREPQLHALRHALALGDQTRKGSLCCCCRSSCRRAELNTNTNPQCPDRPIVNRYA